MADCQGRNRGKSERVEGWGQEALSGLGRFCEGHGERSRFRRGIGERQGVLGAIRFRNRLIRVATRLLGTTVPLTLQTAKISIKEIFRNSLSLSAVPLLVFRFIIAMDVALLRCVLRLETGQG